MAYYVGYGFAQNERHYGLFGRIQCRGLFFADESYARRIERAVGALDLRREPFGAIAPDSLADFAEGFARNLLDVGNLRGGAPGVGREEASGELRFQDDDGKRVAEHIVEIAGDALALGDLGQLLDFLMRELRVCNWRGPSAP